MNKTVFDIQLTSLLLGVTLVLSSWWVYLMFVEVVTRLPLNVWGAAEHAVFMLIGIALFYGSTIYMLTRYGRLKRSLRTKHPAAEEIDEYYYVQEKSNLPGLTILIPSYKEELRIVEMTLLSAALQEYPQKNIVLLLDDPVSYKDPADQALLEATLALPQVLQSELQTVQVKSEKGWQAFKDRRAAGDWDLQREITILDDILEYQQQWYEGRLESFAPTNHAEHFFVELKFVAGRDRVEGIRKSVYDLHEQSDGVDWSTLAKFYRKALSTFDVSLSVFQRKRYENLSHEPNKAMNLNSYIGLIGKSWSEVKEGGELYLRETTKDPFLTVPETKYLITLDADSILSASYARRLIYFMEQPEQERIAVAQTPYNTFRCPFMDLERVAGATTDIQHYVHQGFEHFGASFWVGANALLRFSALHDIKEEDTERGHKICRYVQDRTVIEDTESSIDLVVKDWKVFNYHEQLAYSATPPDFGSLVIQRRRWANGGLIIFPKLVSYLFVGNTPLRSRLVECFVRAHYLISTAFVSTGVLTMILYPFAGDLHVGPLVGVSVLYFCLYARDLILLNYSFWDLLRVYALNLLLIPVNVAGTIKSIQQMIFKTKIPFGRTPKVDGRTAVSIGFILAEFGLMFYMMTVTTFDVLDGRYEHAIFSAINAAFLLYAVSYFIGWRASFEDVKAGLIAKNS